MVKFRNIFILIFMVLFLFSCQKGNEEAKQFSDEYSKLTKEFREKRSNVKTRDEYAAYKEERKTSYENLLDKYTESPPIEEIEILRSKTLLDLQKLDEAEEKIDGLLAKKPTLAVEAKMVKVQILLEREKYDEAYNIFKDIESQVTNLEDKYFTYYYLGSVHEDNKVKEDYSRKFLDAKQLPERLLKYKPQMYSNLATIAKQEKNLDKAREFINKAIAETDAENKRKKAPLEKKLAQLDAAGEKEAGERTKKKITEIDENNKRKKASFDKKLAQLDYIGKKAFPFSAANWINSSPVKMNNLKNKVVILSFWAPWCPHCRKLTPTLKEIYNINKDKGLTVIGFTRFYGSYRDDAENKGKVNKEEELELIKKYLERKQVPYPIAVTDDKSVLDTYKISGLPTLVFIDRNGNIDYTKIGSGGVSFIKNKVKDLLEKI